MRRTFRMDRKIASHRQNGSAEPPSTPTIRGRLTEKPRRRSRPERSDLRLGFGLIGDRLNRAGDLVRIAEIVMTYRPQVVGKLVDQRYPSGNVESDDLGVTDIVEIFDQRAQRIAVRDDDRSYTRGHVRGDCLAPAGKKARDGILEAFGAGQLRGAQAGVTRVRARIARVRELQRRRRNIVAAAPDEHLLIAELARHFGLVEALQRAVVPFIEAPAPVHRDPHQVHLVLHQPERADRALEHGGVRDVESETLLAQCGSRALRLRDAAIREIDVGPAGEAVLPVPGAFAVPKKNELSHPSILDEENAQVKPRGLFRAILETWTQALAARRS